MKREITAGELLASLEHDPKYQAMMAEKAKRRAELEAILEKDERPLVEALTAAGWPENVRQVDTTRSVWDLVNTNLPYPQLLDTLADHLPKPYHERTREAIARSLLVPESRGTQIPRVMMDLLKKETNPDEGANSFRWVLIYVLQSIGDSSLADEVQQLIADPRYASVRSDLERLAKKLKPARKRRPRRS